MDHPLALSLPDRIYQPLLRTAAESGRTPEAVAAEGLAEVVERQEDDPLLMLAGSLKTDLTDVGDRHDELIGRALLDSLRTE